MWYSESPSITTLTQWYCTFLPRDCKQITTEFRFCLSQRSTVWKVSCAGTPNAFAASRKAFIFSMHLNANDVLLIFFTEPSLISFTNLIKKNREERRNFTERTSTWSDIFPPVKYLHNSVPSFRISKKLSMSPLVFMFSPVIVLIHSRHSCASSSLYLLLICNRNEFWSTLCAFTVVLLYSETRGWRRW